MESRNRITGQTVAQGIQQLGGDAQLDSARTAPTTPLLLGRLRRIGSNASLLPRQISLRH